MSIDQSLVYIVDDDAAVRAGLKRLVESIGLEAKVFAGAQDFLDEYDGSLPGCLVLDIRMPEISGTKLQSMISERRINIPIIFITGHADVPTAVDLLKKGAFDLLEKPFSEQVLLGRIQEALDKDLRDRHAFAKRREAVERLQQLSDRERQVLDMVMAGRPNKAMAKELGLSMSTIEVHRASVMKKMKAGSLPELTTLVNMACQEC